MPNGELAISLRDGDKTPSSPLLPSFSHLFASLLFFSLSGIGLFPGMGRVVLTWYVLPWRYWTYCHCVVYLGVQYRRYAGNPTSNQLNKVSPPWDIGTPRHWNPESKHRDIGTSGHWNPECTGRGKGTDLRTGKGHRPEERFSLFRNPLGSHWRSLRCAFHCRAAHGAYDVLGGARWLQVQFLVSLFPRLLRGGASPSLWVANFSNTVYWESFVFVDTVSARVWLVVLDLKPRTDQPWGSLIRTPCTSNPFGCSSIPPVPIWESATIWRLSSQDGRRMVAQASDHLRGAPAFDEARLKTTRSEVDSPGPPAFNKAGDARAWLDTPQPTRAQRMREG